MIDFKNINKIPKRVTKHTVEEGDFFTVSISALEKEDLFEKNKKASQEKLLTILLGAILCDEKGELLKLSLNDLKSLPDALFQDMINVCTNKITGEKKS